jgi:uncharacterized alpha-E superfamily protein
MLSRVARNIYWMARYIERAEDTARLINVNTHLLLDSPRSTSFGWDSLIVIMGNTELFYANYNDANERNVTKFLIGDEKNFSSILSSLAAARENMRTTRDVIPTEAWEHLNDLYLQVKNKVSSGITKRNRYDILKTVISGSQQFVGITAGSSSRDATYNLMRMGRFLERADMTSRILDVRSANLLINHDNISNLAPFAHIQWMSVLKSLTAYQSYRQHVRLRGVKGEDVLRYLLQDNQFPRAVTYCLSLVQQCLDSLPKNDMPLRSLARLERQVKEADVHELVNVGLHKFIDELQVGLALVNDHINTTYFSIDSAPAVKITQSQTQKQVQSTI